MLTVVACLAGAAPAWGGIDQTTRKPSLENQVGPTAIADVRVWYYADNGTGKPVLVKWWTPAGLKVDKEMVYFCPEGRFRVRARLSGEQDSGWLRVTFRDGHARAYESPVSNSKTKDSLLDLFFRVPTNFGDGVADLQLTLWNNHPRSASRREIAETPVLRLGRFELMGDRPRVEVQAPW